MVSDVPLSPVLRLLEAAIFAAKMPITLSDLHQILASLSDDGDDDHDLVHNLELLRRHYQGRGIQLVQTAGAWQFRTAPDLAADLAGMRSDVRRLSRAQIETLAIIAYHQPITRAEIEEIRGVGLHKGTFDLLMEAGWIVPKGRRQSPGRPVTWVTSPGFLHHFGLNSLDDLPNLAELRASGLLETRIMPKMGEGLPDEFAVGADLSHGDP